MTASDAKKERTGEILPREAERVMPVQSNTYCEQLQAILSQFSLDQIRWCIKRLETSTDAEAAEQIGIPPARVYQWRHRSRAPIDEALRLMILDSVATALHIRRRVLAEAMMVKMSGLNSPDERIRQAVASEFIEWELGRATSRSELSAQGVNPLVIVMGDMDDDQDAQ